MSELCINIAKIKNEPQGIRDYPVLSEESTIFFTLSLASARPLSVCWYSWIIKSNCFAKEPNQQIDLETNETYDYIGCEYPYGLDGENAMLFNGEQIQLIFLDSSLPSLTPYIP